MLCAILNCVKSFLKDNTLIHKRKFVYYPSTNQCLQNDITINGAQMWNTLKHDIRNSTSLSKFKIAYLQDILVLTISDIEHISRV